jgi:homoserine dehydrogenase
MLRPKALNGACQDIFVTSIIDLSNPFGEGTRAEPCYSSLLLSGKGSVELRRYPKAHPFAQLNGTDNIISFTTKRYFKQALVVRGPGAGADVTAGGVFGDLLRLAAYLGAPS